MILSERASALFATIANTDDGEPVRVQSVHRNDVALMDLTGRLESVGRAGISSLHEVVTGDWGWRSSTSIAIAPRYSEVRRGSSAHSAGQTLAANLDVIFLVLSPVTADRASVIQRLAAIGWDSGAMPVFLILKADELSGADRDRIARAVASQAIGIEAVFASSVTGEGIPLVESMLSDSTTSVLIGHSGAGKSSLINQLARRDVQDVGEVRTNDSKGRHTTTRRDLIDLGELGQVIDTPGLRELGVVSTASVIDAFPEIEQFASECKYADCSHTVEPGCAVADAISDGLISRERWNGYSKMLKEAAYAERNREMTTRDKNQEWTRLAREYRQSRGH